MQETIEKRKEKLKHKIAIKPVFKPKSKEGIKERKEISVEVKTEKSEGQQKVKAGFVPPTIVGHKLERGKTNLPLFGPKQATKISASEEKMKLTAMEIKVKREVKEHLKGSVEEVVSEPQELKALSSEIEEPKETLVKTNFDLSIPLIGREIEKPLEVPEIKLINFTPSTIKTDFDASLPKIEFKERVVAIPKLSVTKPPEVITRNYFDNEVSSWVISEIKVAEEVETEEEEIATAVGALEKKEIATLEELKEEIGEVGGGLLDIFFAPIDKEHDLKGILRASSERPVVILAEKSDDDYLDALKLILREIYRIKVGGFPEAIVTKKEKEEVEAIKAERRIHVIDDSEGKFFESFKINKVGNFEKVDMDKLLEERIEELFSQGFGFLIFYLKRENFDYLCNSFGIKEHKIPKLILIQGKELKEDEIEKISSASWGFLEPNGSWRSLSDYFSGYEKKFYNKLEKLSETKYAISVRESAEDEEGGKESNLHYLLKIFLVKYLREKLKIEGEIETEKEKEGIIPDIFIPGENLAIEVETLYGTGMARLRRLGKTIEKYKEKRYKLWVVIPNLQLLLFSKSIKEIIKTFRDKAELEIFGVDLSKQELVPFDKFKNKSSLTKWN